MELGALVELLAGLVMHWNETGNDEGLGLGAGLREPTLHEQKVESLLQPALENCIACSSSDPETPTGQ